MRDPWIWSLAQEDLLEKIPLFLPREFHGERSLPGYSPWGCKVSGMTEWLSHITENSFNLAGSLKDSWIYRPHFEKHWYREILKGGTIDPWVGKIPWRRKWQPTPVSLPGKSHGHWSLVGCSPWGRKESGTTERLTLNYIRFLAVHYFETYN